jgi:hypothetical protein
MLYDWSMESNYITGKGSKIVVCAWEGGANTTSFLAAHFAKRNTKNCGEKRSGESEGGQKFLPPNPLPFCPPERPASEASRSFGILLKMSSDFFQQTPQKFCFCQSIM